MAVIEDKIITVKSLSELHNYNKEIYETKNNASSIYETKENATLVETSLNQKVDEVANRVTPIAKGGTNSSNGATGLKNLFASGATVLSSHQYGDELPAAGTKGRIFFKRLTDI